MHSSYQYHISRRCALRPPTFQFTVTEFFRNFALVPRGAMAISVQFTFSLGSSLSSSTTRIVDKIVIFILVVGRLLKRGQPFCISCHVFKLVFSVTVQTKCRVMCVNKVMSFRFYSYVCHLTTLIGWVRIVGNLSAWTSLFEVCYRPINVSYLWLTHFFSLRLWKPIWTVNAVIYKQKKACSISVPVPTCLMHTLKAQTTISRLDVECHDATLFIHFNALQGFQMRSPP